MGQLRTEYEVTCPCCQSTLVIDEGLQPRRPPRRARARRQAEARRRAPDSRRRKRRAATRSSSSPCSPRRRAATRCRRRFEEALKQAKDEPVTQAAARLRPGLNAAMGNEAIGNAAIAFNCIDCPLLIESAARRPRPPIVVDRLPAGMRVEEREVAAAQPRDTRPGDDRIGAVRNLEEQPLHLPDVARRTAASRSGSEHAQIDRAVRLQTSRLVDVRLEVASAPAAAASGRPAGGRAGRDRATAPPIPIGPRA